MGNKQRIYRNVSWALLGKIVNILSGLFVGILVARYLGPENFGVMNYVISYVTLFTVLSNFGMENIEIREMAKHEDQINEIMGTAFVLRLFFGALAILLVWTTLQQFQSDSFVFWMVMVYSISLVLSSFNVIRNYFTSIVLNEYVVKTEIARTLLGAAVKLVLLWLKAPLEYFIVAITMDFALVASGYIISFRARRGKLRQWKVSKQRAGYLIRESFPFLLSGTVIVLYQKIDQVLINHLLDAGKLGQFSVASKLLEVGLFLPAIVCQTVTPILVRKRRDNLPAYLLLRQQFVDLLVWGSLILSLSMSLSASIFITMLFSSSYQAAIPVLQIMAWKILLVAAWSATGQIIVIEGIQKWAVFRNLIGCVCCVGFNLWLIPIYGINGSAIATLITMFCSGFLAHFIIPPYRFLADIQVKAFFFGWKSLLEYGKQGLKR